MTDSHSAEACHLGGQTAFLLASCGSSCEELHFLHSCEYGLGREYRALDDSCWSFRSTSVSEKGSASHGSPLGRLVAASSNLILGKSIVQVVLLFDCYTPLSKAVFTIDPRKSLSDEYEFRSGRCLVGTAGELACPA